MSSTEPQAERPGGAPGDRALSGTNPTVVNPTVDSPTGSGRPTAPDRPATADRRETGGGQGPRVAERPRAAGGPGRHRPAHRGRRRGGLLTSLAEWLAIVAVGALAAIGIKTWVVQAFYIPSASMEPTLGINNRILVDKLSYDLHAIHRGDIVVFTRPPNDRGDPSIKDLVKRVVGLPGETISSAHGHVVINGRPLAEPYLPPGAQTSGIPTQTIPSGHYFVMGDNRTDSADSRVFGPIPGSLIVGRTVVRVWPPSRLHVF